MESKEQKLTLTMDDVRKTNHNLYGGMDFLTKPKEWDEDFDDWDENTILTIEEVAEEGVWNNKQVTIYEVSDEVCGEFGYAVSIDGEIKHIISIYEQQAVILAENEGVIAVYGHEELIVLSLVTGKFKEVRTR